MYKVVEKFVSINGEGLKAGELAVFIRFAGCNLSCSYCDTKWANESECIYVAMSGEDIYNYIKETGIKNVTLTGGEPLMQKEINCLIDLLLKDKSIKIEIETNGSVDFRKIKFDNPNISLTVDYKCKSSLMEEFMNKEMFKFLTKKDSVKFVVGNNEDLNLALDFIREYDLFKRSNVLFSSIFNEIEPKEIVDFMRENNLIEAKLQLQMHKYIWDRDARGV